MKKTYNSELGTHSQEPETAIEAVEQLEAFLIADLGQPWDAKFLRSHFDICKGQIINLEQKKK
jgi:hypothetical protein